MRYDLLSSSLFAQRRAIFSKQMKKNSIAVFFSNRLLPRTADQTFPFRQDSDLFAMSGMDQPGTLLLLNPGADNPDDRELLFLLPSSPGHAIWHGKRYTKKEAQQISGIRAVYPINLWDKITRPLFDAAQTIYVNAPQPEEIVPSRLPQDAEKLFDLQKKWSGKHFISAGSLLQKQRMLKISQEVEVLKKAVDVTGQAFNQVLKTVQPGQKEYEVEAEITRSILRAGCQHAFEPIIASGKSACILHYIRNDGLLQPGTLLLLDFGAEYACMASDMSRTIPVSGKFTPRQKEIYQVVLFLLNQVTDLMRPGITLPQLNAETGKMIDSALIQLRLITKKALRNQDPKHPVRRKYFMHGVSHHLGWDVHDPSVQEAPLKPGMILTCEPGLYIPEERIGIRLENDIHITRGNPKNLMAHIPIDPDEIEALMQTRTV